MAFGFLVFSWPFIRYPLTDGDIAHWVGIAKEISVHNNFLSSAHDQAHGPLLTWTAGILVKLGRDSLYLYNLFNLFCGLLGIAAMAYLGERLWPGKKVGSLAADNGN